MDQLKELRLDIFIYFILLATSVPLHIIIMITVVFTLRFWYPEIVAEIQREIEEFEDDEKKTYEEAGSFEFEGLNDLESKKYT